MNKNTKIALAATGLTLLFLLRAKAKNKKFHKLTDANEHRGCDINWGCGYFGASRGGGTREHRGLDIKITKSQRIYSPINGVVKRIAYPYASDTKYKGIVIENETYYIKIFYMNMTVTAGDKIRKGEVIGFAQNIAEKYDARMTPHVHIEVYKNGVLIDPTNLF